MKISFPRHIVYTVLFTIFLIIFSIWFAVAKLIPMGQEYRLNRAIVKKEKADLQRYEDFYNKTLQIYNEKKTKNRHIIQAFQATFDPQRFIKLYQKHFITLKLSKVSNPTKEQWYETYEVNTTSKIKSPKNFYNFLDAINKSEWIVGVTFPIDFSRDAELIHSSFKMQVYKKSVQENNTTKKVQTKETP
jgi:hypothetical protein